MSKRIYGVCNQCELRIWKESSNEFKGLEKENVDCIACDGRSVDPLGNCIDVACLYQHGATWRQKLVKRFERFLGL